MTLLELRPSKIHRCLVVAIYVLAFSLLLFFPLMWLWKLALLGAVGVHCYFYMQHLKNINRIKGLRYMHAPLELVWKEQIIITEHSAVVFFSAFLVILKLRWNGRNLYLPVFFDMCAVDDFRRFRVWAKQALNGSE